MKYRVAVFHDVEADSPLEAEAVARQRVDPEARVLVTPLDLPEGRHHFSRHYVQPIRILDLAWDQYMDRTLPAELRTDSRTPRLPSLLDLAAGKVDPAGLSMLFDMAITAYVQRPKYLED